MVEMFLEFAGQHGQHRVVAQLVVVVKVFIAERDAGDALHRQGLDRVLGVGRVAAVLEAGSEARVRPSTLLAASSSKASASDVIVPPSNEATTARPATGANAPYRVRSAG